MAKTKTSTSKRKPVWQLSRRGVYGGMALIVTACAWTFFLGVLVGRGTAPVSFDIEKLGQDLKALREQVQQQQAQQLQAYSAAVETKSDLDFYEDLKQPGENPARDLNLTRTTPQPAPAPDADRSVEDEAGSTAEILIKRPMPGLQAKKKAAVQPPKTAAPAKAGAEASSAEGALTLQVASLRDAKMADQMVARLQKAGYRASRSSVTIPGKGVWYRVHVGRFADREAAAATMRKLQSKGLRPILVAH